MYVVKSLQEPIPKDVEFDGLILLGGDPGISSEEMHSFTKEERLFLVEWLTHEKPCLGFCLGHELLTKTFQAKVIKNSVSSVGFIQGHLTHDGRRHPLFQGITPSFMMFKWHSQSIQTPIPQNIILLATSNDCVVEAYTIKGRPYIVGLQFDNHAAHPSDVSKWLESKRGILQSSFFDDEFGDILISEAKNSLRTNEKILFKLIENFIAMTKESTSNSR